MPLFEGVAYGGEKSAVIVDIGGAYTKCGFGGEPAPRCIIPSDVIKQSGETRKVTVFKNEAELYDNLVDFLHRLYFRHLLVNPKDRRVVVVESVLCPSVFRNTLAKVLFKHYEVPSVLFAPSHLMALFTLGISSGLVLDAGLTETLVLPIYESIPILKAWQAVPLAGNAIHSRLESQLLETGIITTDESEKRPLSSALGSLSQSTLEDIKVRCCFVTRMDRAKQLQDAQLQESGLQEVDPTKIPTPPPGVDYPLDGGKILHIDGKIRENSCEVLFERDNDEKSIATLILDAILECPIDIRRVLAENIVVVGGTAMLPGFQHRLLAEVHELVEQQRYRDKLAIRSFKLHKPPSKANFTVWLGGAIFGALEILGSRSISKEAYNENNTIPDWSTLSDNLLSEPEPSEKLPGVK
ncbi:unnamed protein product [Owenia fusiformis]|uniref:Uncharacterized protein n=1 Tax=Owenia fusiformis TaxID=6347 RepID=A0A8J1U7U2_OWEFU|nr:unnamed protein product [Owenia fusiformis]